MRSFPQTAALIALALAIASPAFAEPPKKPDDSAAKTADKAVKAADKAGDKAGDKAAKAGEKADDKAKGDKPKDDKAKDDKADDKAKGEGPKSDKAEVKKKAKEDRDALKAKVEKKLAGKPAPAALKQELKRHARRLARLERIQALATDAKDDDALARVKKLIDKENERHDKWMDKFDPSKEAAK